MATPIDLLSLLDAAPEYRIPRQRADATRRKPARRTVGSILVPELPGYWPGRDGPRVPASRAIELLREDDPPLTPDEDRELTRWMKTI